MPDPASPPSSIPPSHHPIVPPKPPQAATIRPRPLDNLPAPSKHTSHPLSPEYARKSAQVAKTDRPDPPSRRFTSFLEDPGVPIMGAGTAISMRLHFGWLATLILFLLRIFCLTLARDGYKIYHGC
ncbi:hypothetical protein H0G86_007411 [Trichoderma simmonsii]|uniref:Uncharacterized protein n=1 Tax=Trichoderma simmonsii TaxID=1491479 RepID=A0A8G0LHZ0_9HYPO|nr:hypothetical protein H0G86_007411 [Trichoderma simmonsii]